MYIENPVTQACEIFGNLSTIEVNPSLLLIYVTCIVHKCIDSRSSSILCKDKLFGYLFKSMFA